jgi:hypothetical protein
MSIDVYFSTMRGLADEMVAAAKPLDDDDVISYILNGLDADYNSLIEHVNSMTEPISPETLYSRLLDTEAHLASQKAMQYEQKGPYQLMANVVTRGGHDGNMQVSRGNSSHNNNNRGGFGRGNGGGHSSNPNNLYKDHQCQVCGKFGHTALRCWKRFDKNFFGPETKTANASTSSYQLDPSWYADSVATDHITGDLDKLTAWENYGDHDQVHTANGSGMAIQHIGQSMVTNPSRQILLKNVLHVPQATKSIASVHKLITDNDVFLELHSTFFLMKDRLTIRPLLHGRCRNGLYPIPSLASSSGKLCLSAIKPSKEQWHGRLDHPSFRVVSQVINRHQLPVVSNKSVDHVCDACQQAKSHQLPFPKSVSVSKVPLNLCFL